jgi:hypothetical protein
MHRVLASQTRLLCDYCKSWIQCEQAVHVEELCIAGKLDRAHSERVIREWLARQGVHKYELRKPSAGTFAVWHLSSEAGEELFLPATPDAGPLLQKLRPSAAPMVEMDQRDPDIELGELAIERPEAEQAAMAAFRDKDPRLATIRLLWLPYCSFRVEFGAGGSDAFHVLGSERPLLEPLPDGARALPARPELLSAFFAFVLLLYLVALLLPSRALASVVLAAMLTAVLPVWAGWAARRGVSS